ncbi:hypothetical protein [Candidatus Absconditicoccus praedator]|uniref:hypothetical protein n=1 Tax=Candidatus Absconditicoccus praedator TaxID=2735562 RepID=UPI001E583CDF|nr:hypothetical protein [Candidatus Absconditicoccus praedator]UFX83321.1 hypothetical protein HLG78_04300 [Candidatus Absconditicoccus praedator]
MKKSFTLLEIVVVILVLSIVLSIFSYIGKRQIDEAEFRLAKESFFNDFNSYAFYSKSPMYEYGSRWSTGYTKIFSGKNISKEFLGFPNQSDQVEYGKNTYDKMYFSEFNIDGNSYGTGIFIKESYKFGCNFYDIENEESIGSDNVEFKMISDFDESRKYCISVDLRSCKIKQVGCQN